MLSLVVGEVAVGDAVFGIDVNNAPQRHSGGGGHQVVGDDAVVSRIAAVAQVDGTGLRGTVGFFERDEVDAIGVFEFEPVAVVDTRLVPDEHDLATLGRTVAKLVGRAALDDGDVVGFLFTVLGIGHAEAAQVVAGQVHAEEVSGGDGAEFALGAFDLFVETGGVVVMAVHGVNVPVVEFFALGVGIGDALLHRPGEQLVEGGDVGEPTRAFESFEKVVGFDVGVALVGMKLEKLLAGGRAAQAAQHAELAVVDVVVDVGNVGAPVLARGLGVELENVREKAVGEFIVNVLRVSHNFFQPNRISGKH